jgi:hypothetical protein
MAQDLLKACQSFAWLEQEANASEGAKNLLQRTNEVCHQFLLDNSAFSCCCWPNPFNRRGDWKLLAGVVQAELDEALASDPLIMCVFDPPLNSDRRPVAYDFEAPQSSTDVGPWDQ